MLCDVLKCERQIIELTKKKDCEILNKKMIRHGNEHILNMPVGKREGLSERF